MLVERRHENGIKSVQESRVGEDPNHFIIRFYTQIVHPKKQQQYRLNTLDRSRSLQTTGLSYMAFFLFTFNRVIGRRIKIRSRNDYN